MARHGRVSRAWYTQAPHFAQGALAALAQMNGAALSTDQTSEAFRAARALHDARAWTPQEAALRALLVREPGKTSALRELGLHAAAKALHPEATLWFKAALEVEPANAQAHADLGVVLRQQGLNEESARCFDRAAELSPDNAAMQLTATLSRATRLDEQGRSADAMAAFEAATRDHPDSADAWAGLGAVQRFSGQREEAAFSFQRALQIDPARLELIDLFAKTLRELRRHGDEAVVLAHLLRLDPQRAGLPGRLMHSKLDAADWTALAELESRIESEIAGGRMAAGPFTLMACCADPKVQLMAARQHAGSAEARVTVPAARGKPAHGDKLRIGYVAGEFRNHAVAVLLTGVLEHHDRSRFEVVAFDTAQGDDSVLRRRIEAAVDIVSLRGLDTAAAIDAVRSRQIDILIDLNGYTGAARHDLFASRTAPIQVNYLGYPGTTGLDAIDYVIADRIVIPPSAQENFSEKVVYLPQCYQPNDTQRVIADEPSSRTQLGVPEDAFVFCCMNHVFKILPGMFDIWMRLLLRVPGSVLMLYSNNPETQSNLQHEAEERGIDPARLIFGGPLDPGSHLARLRLCDLFLDSWPYNAHTSGSDALWAGLPMITCTGNTFASRVGASLLNAVGLSELATESFTDYEAMALRLATNPALMAETRQRLNANRLSSPLFDIVRYTRHLEAAYLHMASHDREGLPAASFSVNQAG